MSTTRILKMALNYNVGQKIVLLYRHLNCQLYRVIYGGRDIYCHRNDVFGDVFCTGKHQVYVVFEDGQPDLKITMVKQEKISQKIKKEQDSDIETGNNRSKSQEVVFISDDETELVHSDLLQKAIFKTTWSRSAEINFPWDSD